MKASIGFHPAVFAWFKKTFGCATPVQVQAWPLIQAGQHVLAAAPTGSGKTLAAFMVALDALFRRALADGPLPDETYVVYVSPLKALSTDIHLNLDRPLAGIRSAAEEAGLEAPHITTGIRTGDTTASRRASMTRRPPHILVTTPESLYLLLTAERSRATLRTVRTVIVDEIHAVLPSRRGAHLTLTLERLAHVACGPIQRIGLSATQRPLNTVAQFLVGPTGGTCATVDLGHQRAMDIALELPASPLDAVMAHEVWAEIYDRLSALAHEHRTTLVFVNGRRLAERIARHVAERLGPDLVAAHHGSLSRATRAEAERRLRNGELKIIIATASLELGIDIGAVELVCTIGSPRSISTFVQRIGRAGHHVGGISKGRLFPTTRDDLLECAALMHALRQGELEDVAPLLQPLDVLAQQVVAESAAEESTEEALFDLVRRAYPYRDLTWETFGEVIHMLAHGFVTDRGRRSALLFHDGINRRVKGRKGARLTALTCGGAIPDNADLRVVLEPEETFVGTVNEDFAAESIAGDIFQLGNTSWRIRRIGSGVVRVEDAMGAPPNIPFWFGEAPQRSNALSAAVSRLRSDCLPHMASRESSANWLVEHYALPVPAADQLAEYLWQSVAILGTLPTQKQIVAERFFDESGGMQLVLHAPFGARVNRAWGLALRKRFCRKFNFELQAAATEDAILLSLGPQHSFPLADVLGYLTPGTLHDILVQAVLDAPMFHTRWRWNVNIALAVPRRRGGRKVPAPLQRMQAEDILVSVFPDAAACLENVGGDRAVPQHPLVAQTLYDCLQVAMDYERLCAILTGLEQGTITFVTRDVQEPSPLSHEILTAKPYAFLDDAPLEERRTQAAHRRRAFVPVDSHGVLDAEVVKRVCAEVRAEARDADELHDVLLTAGWIPAPTDGTWAHYFATLAAQGRATQGIIKGTGQQIWLSAERLHEAVALWDLVLNPTLAPTGAVVSQQSAAQTLARGYLETSGPVTAAHVAQVMGLSLPSAECALTGLEGSGDVLRGTFTSQGSQQWCHRRLLARMHRRTIARRREEVRPVPVVQYMRFLMAWQHVAAGFRVAGLAGLHSVIAQIDGFSAAAAAWEPDILSLRVEGFEPAMLDTLCFTGRVGWCRRSANKSTSAAPVRSTPIALYLQKHAPLLVDAPADAPLSGQAQRVLDVLAERGATFMGVIRAETKLFPTQIEAALAELVSRGLVTSDGFAGLRMLLAPVDTRRRGHRKAPLGMQALGRWSLVPAPQETDEDAIEAIARILLRRYGIVCRRILVRETDLPPWRALVRTYWRLEARGEIRGGRFLAGVPGEHFGLPEAVGLLRSAGRNKEMAAEPIAISAADPLNLEGILTPGPRIPALASNRILFRQGVVVATAVAGETTFHASQMDTASVKKALLTQPGAAALRPRATRSRRATPLA